MATLKIGQVADRVGVNIDTVRYYERAGLLPPPARRPSGYRCYDNQTIRRLRFIRRAKALGFSLVEIEDLLTISDEQDVAAVKVAAGRKLADLERRLTELTRIRDALAGLVEHCPGHGDPADCPILGSLNEDGAY